MITAALGGVLVLQDRIGVTIIFGVEEGGLQGTLDEHWIDPSRSEWLGTDPATSGHRLPAAGRLLQSVRVAFQSGWAKRRGNCLAHPQGSCTSVPARDTWCACQSLT